MSFSWETNGKTVREAGANAVSIFMNYYWTFDGADDDDDDVKKEKNNKAAGEAALTLACVGQKKNLIKK